MRELLKKLQQEVRCLYQQIKDLSSNPTDLSAYQLTSQKGQPFGYASLDSNGLVPNSQLPSYVDDVLEFPNLLSFPITGETGKIYIAQNTNLQYRWGGSAYFTFNSSQDLHNVLSQGNGSTLNIILTDLNDPSISSNLFAGDLQVNTGVLEAHLNPFRTYVRDTDNGSEASINANGTFSITNGASLKTTFSNSLSTLGDITLLAPDKASGSYILATLEDVFWENIPLTQDIKNTNTGNVNIYKTIFTSNSITSTGGETDTTNVVYGKNNLITRNSGGASDNNIIHGENIIPLHDFATQNTLIGKNIASGVASSLSRSVIVGISAYSKQTDGNRSVVIGNFAGFNNQGVGDNTLLGFGVASNNFSNLTGVSFSQTVSIGTLSGNDLTTGTGNIFLGHSAGQSVSTGSYNIHIGRNSIGVISGNNNVVIGNVNIGNVSNTMVFATGGNAAGIERFRVDSNGNFGIGTTAPNSSALLDVSSTSKGVLVPRMNSTQRNSIVSPATGLVIYNTDINQLETYSGTQWQERVTSRSIQSVWLFTDFLTNNAIQHNFNGTSVSGGTVSANTSFINNAYGVVDFTSSATANSGYSYIIGNNQILIKGNEFFVARFATTGVTGSTIRAGFHDTANSTTPVDGVYFEINTTTGTVTLIGMNNGVSSSVAFTNVVASTMFRYEIDINSNATQATGRVYNNSGTLLQTLTLSSNIPTGGGRFTGAGVIATNSGTVASVLCNVDALGVSFRINR